MKGKQRRTGTGLTPRRDTSWNRRGHAEAGIVPNGVFPLSHNEGSSYSASKLQRNIRSAVAGKLYAGDRPFHHWPARAARSSTIQESKVGSALPSIGLISGSMSSQATLSNRSRILIFQPSMSSAIVLRMHLRRIARANQLYLVRRVVSGQSCPASSTSALSYASKKPYCFVTMRRYVVNPTARNLSGDIRNVRCFYGHRATYPMKKPAELPTVAFGTHQKGTTAVCDREFAMFAATER